MEEDVLNALQTRTAYLPGSFDRDGKIIIIVNAINDLQLWNRKYLELSINYIKRSLSAAILQKGVTIIVDAQNCGSRMTRSHVRTIYALFGDIDVNLFLVKSEGFWEKHVEHCTKSTTTKGEPTVLSKARLSKYFELNHLPEELGGTLQFNYDLWLHQRKSIDDFEKSYEQTVMAMDNLHLILVNRRSLRPAEASVELKNCAQLHTAVQRHIEEAIQLGNYNLMRLTEAYSPHKAAPSTLQTSTATNEINSSSASSTLATSPAACTATATIAGGGGGNKKHPLPPDLNCERVRIELRLNDIEKKQTEIRTAWLELLQSMRDARELAALEEGVAFVTNWILSTAELMLSRQQSIGSDVHMCEALLSAHSDLEMECRQTYGFYAELLYKIDSYAGSNENDTYKDLISQKEFMHFVCRSFATRLERRRNVLITSLRFFRLVTEYFDRTTQVFESLVMNNKTENLDAAADNLQQLKESQSTLANIERELIKEGEKLSDMLAMPVKDALGRDLHIDYSGDIYNVREILDTTIARRNIFGDSVELQKLTLEQVTHIHTYETDAQMAINWMDDLYNVMIKYHSHVGCNIHEIQVQKEELQTFQETGKSIYNYGCQLLEASFTLRTSCKLDVMATQEMSRKLQFIWHSLQAISQEHLTRLRVSAVFHRSVEEYSQRLLDLKMSVSQILAQQQHEQNQLSNSHSNNNNNNNSSSGICSDSSSSDSQSTSSDSSSPADQEAVSLNVEKPIIANTTTMTTTTPASAEAQHAELLQPSLPLSALLSRRDQLHKYLADREQLLVEVGRMVRLGRLLKTRLKEPFVLDAITGRGVILEDSTIDVTSSLGDSGRSSNVSNEDGATTTTTTTTTTIAASNNATTTTTTTPSNEVTTDTTPTIIVKPAGDNAMACNTITNKLTEITKVAESLDSVIRDVRNNEAEAQNETETNSTNSSSDKKMDNLSEDWHSRSTEEESFATASEGNFTPHSHSSSFQTASGRTTSSFIGSSKNSYDANEADNSQYAFETPELTPSSDRSYLSAQPTSPIPSILLHSIGVVEEVRSQSVTPTPAESHFESIPIIESDCELPITNIEDSPSMEILTEVEPMMSVTPEVSMMCSSSSSLSRRQRRSTNNDNNHNNNNNNNNNNANKSSNAAWRRSKYYENITKQTIKGFL